MATRESQTYDDITRRTVPDPDSSVRPTKDQERQAFEGYRAMDESETALYGRVMDALRGGGMDWQNITVEIDRDRVSVRGTVNDEDDLQRIPDLIRGIDGVASVDDRLVVLPGGSAD